MTKIDIVSGFLGAGKTTLIKKMLSEAYQGEKLVLIENEFGEISIDGGFLKDSGVQISEMSSGCICCSLVGDFSTALKDVKKQFAPDRILIEPSGVGKLSSYMNLPKDWSIQLSGQYRSPFMDLQTDMMASYWADLAVKKDLFQKRATLSLRVEDVFCTGGFGHLTDSEQLYRDVRSKRLSPTVTIGFQWKINKGLQQKPKMENMEEEGGDGSF